MPTNIFLTGASSSRLDYKQRVVVLQIPSSTYYMILEYINEIKYMTSKSTTLAGAIVSIFGPIAFIGDFIVKTKKSIIIGAVFLVLLVILIAVYIAAVESGGDENNTISLGTAFSAIVIICGIGIFACYVSGITINFVEYSKK